MSDDIFLYDQIQQLKGRVDALEGDLAKIQESFENIRRAWEDYKVKDAADFEGFRSQLADLQTQITNLKAVVAGNTAAAAVADQIATDMDSLAADMDARDPAPDFPAVEPGTSGGGAGTTP